MARRILPALLLVLAVLTALALCTGSEPPGDESGWQDISLTDVVGGEAFTIGGLAAKRPVIIQTYSTGCPGCAFQMEEIARLQRDYPDAFWCVLIAPEPATDPGTMRERFTSAGLSGYAAVPPPEFTRGMVERFGWGAFASYPSLFVVDRAGASALLSNGAIPASEIGRRLAG